MKHDQPHPFQNALLHAIDDFIRHLGVGDMPPPDQDVRLRQTGFRQTMFRIPEASLSLLREHHRSDKPFAMHWCMPSG